MIKLSDLKAARAKMEPGPYTHDPCEPPAGSVNIRGSRCLCDDPKELCPQHECIAEWVPLDTAIGIEATHAAADVLIEITEAALAWRVASLAWHAAMRLMNSAENSDAYSAAWQRLQPLTRDRDMSLTRLTTALTKVQL